MSTEYNQNNTEFVPQEAINRTHVFERLLDNASARDRRSIAIRFLRSNESLASLLRKCDGADAAAMNAQLTMACVLLMVKDDAPQDLVMTDAGLYAVLRQRITDARLAGWGVSGSD